MEKHQIKTDLKQSSRDLLKLLDNVSEEQFNANSRNGGWTIGQVAEHLIKVETSTVRLFSGTATISDRDPEEKIAWIKKRFLDYKTKMNAFGPIIPSEGAKDKKRSLEKIQDLRQKLAGLIDLQDMTEVIADFAHPLFGPLTRVEWIYFNIYHSTRHSEQIKRILKALTED